MGTSYTGCVSETLTGSDVVEKRLNSAVSVIGSWADCFGEDCDVVGWRYELTSKLKNWLREASASASWPVTWAAPSENTADLSTLDISIAEVMEYVPRLL
jgi:hypothetical protein